MRNRSRGLTLDANTHVDISNYFNPYSLLLLIFTLFCYFLAGGDNSAFSSPDAAVGVGRSVHSAFLTQNPFSMEALLNRPPLPTGITPPSQRLHRHLSFPATSSATASGSPVNPYLSYPAPFPTSPITPFFMSQLAAAGLSAFTGLQKLPTANQLNGKSELGSPGSERDSRK